MLDSLLNLKVDVDHTEFPLLDDFLLLGMGGALLVAAAYHFKKKQWFDLFIVVFSTVSWTFLLRFFSVWPYGSYSFL